MSEQKTKRTRGPWFYTAVGILVVAIVLGAVDSWVAKAASWLLLLVGVSVGTIAAARSRRVKVGTSDDRDA